MICKKCFVQMKPIYSFYGFESEQKLSCPLCRTETFGKPIEYDNNGFILQTPVDFKKEEAA